MSRLKHEHIGLVELRVIVITENFKDAEETMFLLDIDKSTKRVCATYGPFMDKSALNECASLHSLKITYGV
jgi:hypothetical protein